MILSARATRCDFLFITFNFSTKMVESLEDCIWGRSNWSVYTEKLVGATRIDEGILLERINVVKENIGQQIREAVSLFQPN